MEQKKQLNMLNKKLENMLNQLKINRNKDFILFGLEIYSFFNTSKKKTQNLNSKLSAKKKLI